MSQPIFQNSERDCSKCDENDGIGQPYLKTVHIEVVRGELESEKDVVKDANRDRGSNAVCGA